MSPRIRQLTSPSPAVDPNGGGLRLCEGGAVAKRTGIRRQRAFTLVEVAMAGLIVVVGFIGMVRAVSIGLDFVDTARRQTLAAEIVQSEITRLRSYSWAQISSLGNSSSLTLDTALANLNSRMTVSRTVTTVRTNLRKVTITVTWTSLAGRQHSRSTEAYFGKYGLNLSYQRS